MKPALLAYWHLDQARGHRARAKQELRHFPRVASNLTQHKLMHLNAALTVIRHCAGGRVREDARQLLKVVESLT